jgi:hypothetical protein
VRSLDSRRSLSGSTRLLLLLLLHPQTLPRLLSVIRTMQMPLLLLYATTCTTHDESVRLPAHAL